MIDSGASSTLTRGTDTSTGLTMGLVIIVGSSLLRAVTFFSGKRCSNVAVSSFWLKPVAITVTRMASPRVSSEW